MALSPYLFTHSTECFYTFYKSDFVDIESHDFSIHSKFIEKIPFSSRSLGKLKEQPMTRDYRTVFVHSVTYTIDVSICNVFFESFTLLVEIHVIMRNV